MKEGGEGGGGGEEMAKKHLTPNNYGNHYYPIQVSIVMDDCIGMVSNSPAHSSHNLLTNQNFDCLVEHRLSCFAVLCGVLLSCVACERLPCVRVRCSPRDSRSTQRIRGMLISWNVGGLSGTFHQTTVFYCDLDPEPRLSGSQSRFFTLRRIDHGRLPLLRLSKIAHPPRIDFLVLVWD
jgi:hypothetical protein